jgi:hypothetical protein
MRVSEPSQRQPFAAADDWRSRLAGLGDRLCCALWIAAAIAGWTVSLEVLGALTRMQ